MARDLEHEDTDGVVGRLGRLTQSQRAAVAEAMERILELGDCTPGPGGGAGGNVAPMGRAKAQLQRPQWTTRPHGALA